MVSVHIAPHLFVSAAPPRALQISPPCVAQSLTRSNHSLLALDPMRCLHLHKHALSRTFVRMSPLSLLSSKRTSPVPMYVVYELHAFTAEGQSASDGDRIPAYHQPIIGGVVSMTLPQCCFVQPRTGHTLVSPRCLACEFWFWTARLSCTFPPSIGVSMVPRKASQIHCQSKLSLQLAVSSTSSDDNANNLERYMFM